MTALLTVIGGAISIAYILVKWWFSKKRKTDKAKEVIENEIKNTVNNGTASDINGLINDIDQL